MRLAAVFLALVLAPAATSAGKPTLRVTTVHPLEVRGLHFKRSERVRVVVTVDEVTRTRLVRATRHGTFTVRFATVHVQDRCSLEVSAQGAGGSRASYKLPQRLCPPSLGAPSPQPSFGFAIAR